MLTGNAECLTDNAYLYKHKHAHKQTHNITSNLDNAINNSNKVVLTSLAAISLSEAIMLRIIETPRC